MKTPHMVNMPDKKNSSLRSVTIYLEFDPDLQKVTGTAREQVEVTEGTPFLMFLQAIFDTYPQIMKHYPFSTLSFAINGIAPSLKATLTEYDIVTLLVTGDKKRFLDIFPHHYRH